MYRYGDTASSTTGSSISGGRWDAERFMRERSERHEPTRRERHTAVEVIERDRVEKRVPSFVEDYLNAQEKYGPPARRPDREYADDHLLSSADALIPYKERRRASPSPPRKPRLLRRQSSLDTFDRAATRFANDYYQYDRDDYGPPVVPRAASRRHSPPSEPDFEAIRVSEPDYYGDEEFHRMRDRVRSVTPRGRYSVREEIRKEKVDRPYPRRGKTRVPKHLVHPGVLLDLGYKFEEEGDNIIILQALGKENIDELVSFSREVRRKTRVEEVKGQQRLVSRSRRETVSVERTRSKSRRRSSSVIRPKAEFLEVRETRQTRRVSPSPAPAPTLQPRRRRLSSPIRVIQPRERFVEEIIQPNTDVALIVPERHRRSDRELRAEIHSLEGRRLLTEHESIAPGDVIEVRRDHKGPSQRLIRAMMATLT
ncbi:uncharacterized protein CIMG_08179 [Coccidioides immitis RS]|uniref:DUF8035 domain-containing protein n=3 Tax=Coccidioides immitis TaxID=5501 RepID=A0A0E1RWT3_COCIM|nr:uncharacterized protein CIMG_08179 [Coccidioides immitis RS]EAS29433.2 hypothetical protein CIMG_08179 [Coccidioides immitis RS]KMP06577.1 hypothetical protein CIRG_06258 [Coccidioides immitis RMSCC 2394]KMU73752.1 hypothetical protein CISG_03802 [Coccidioides immitis RMSCC 3703]TPX22484.1 hypothetical protein DIZ76_014356 [Coccidioides immitis]